MTWSKAMNFLHRVEARICGKDLGDAVIQHHREMEEIARTQEMPDYEDRVRGRGGQTAILPVP